MTRLVVVSNRVPAPGEETSAGGLAVALGAALREARGLWFGWSGRVESHLPDTPNIVEHGGITYATMDLDEAAYSDYYNGYANRTLWPLFHYRLDLTNFDREHYEAYRQVNALFARHLLELLKPGDMVWVHDYHLIPLGRELRRGGAKHPLGFFLHTPFPAPEVLTTLPNHRGLIRSLFAYDIVGFQTETDLKAFQEYVVKEIGGRVLGDNALSAYGRTMRAGAYPIGLDTKQFVELASSPQARHQAQAMRQSLHGRHLITGVDRLDYTKGLAERLRAFEQLLERYPDNLSRVCLLQIAPPSRTDVPEYIDMRHELEALAGHINGRFAEVDWVPIRYISKHYSRRSIAGLFRASRIGLITPLRDGMNLVAMEYVAAQDEEDPGVLVLSRFAGAARRLTGALIVNPHDVVEVAETLQQGLEMPREERRARWAEMMETLLRDDVHAWRNRFLGALGTVKMAA